jgi:hypothetical protein
VEGDDNTWRIAWDRGLDFNTVVAWNRLAYGDNWNPATIWPGNIIYLEDPRDPIAIPNPPQASHSGQVFNGYIEGTGFTFVALFTVLVAEGEEIVYDFETLERSRVIYKGENIFLGLFCGLSTDLLGIGQSWYTGFFHFPPRPASLESAYAGTSAGLSVGVGTGLNPLSGPLGTFDMGGQATAFISADGQEIVGIPTVTDYSRVGATISLTAGVNVGRLPVNLNFIFLNYTVVETEQYVTVDAMMRDMIRGKGTESFAIPVISGLFTTSRIFFADQLHQMYEP